MVYHGFGFSPLVVDMLLSDIDPSVARPAKHARTAVYSRMPVDIIEKESEFEIKADVPGVEKEAIHLDIDRDTLTLAVSQPAATQANTAPTPDPEAPAATDGNIPSEPAAATEAVEQLEATEAPAQPKVLRRERAQHFAKRTLKLPATANLEQARAECVAGVLTVTVPKRALPSLQRIPIA